MTDATPAISMNEVADVLRRVARGETEAVQISPAVFLADGFEICIYIDAGYLDYVEWVRAPDGRHCDFEDWGHILTPEERALEPWELAAKRPDLDILEPLDLLSEKEQEALQKILIAEPWLY